MFADDFEFAGELLSSHGLIICDFDGKSGFQNVQTGASTSFNTKPLNSGKKHILTSVSYEDPIQIEFSICKDHPEYSSRYFTIEEYNDTIMWLNRETFYPLRIVQSGYEDVIFNGGFSAEVVEHRGRPCGFNLTFSTDSPFAHLPDVSGSMNFTDSVSDSVVVVKSEIVGYTPMIMQITCSTNGDVKITNPDGKITIITGCVSGEVVTIDSDNCLIYSSKSSHDVSGDFNYVFPKLVRTYDSNENTFHCNTQCSVSYKYSPIVKVVV